jgi:hypothetical protein
MGMPTIVSASPAYVRTMEKCGLDMYCHNKNDWVQKIENHIADDDARQNAGITGRKFTGTNYSEEHYLLNWDNLLKSVLTSIS